MTAIVPRYYQDEAVASIFAYFAANPEGNPVIAMPTGTGKAIVIAEFCRRVLQRWPGQRIMMLTHVKELVAQNADKLKRMWPQAPLGIYAAGLKLKQARMPLTFASYQSAAKNPAAFGHQDIILVDECHLVSPDEAAAYQKLIAFLKEVNPHLRVIGLSATIYRLGLGMITDNGIFTDVCYDITSMNAFNRLLDEGYLCPLIPMQTAVQLDVSGVHKRGGEFIESELQDAVTKRSVTVAALREMLIATHGVKQHVLIFATGIEHVELIAEILRGWGVECGTIHSKSKDRDGTLVAFKRGDFAYLVNANVLTTGFDFPELDCIVLLRPTNSTVLHVQMLGRLTRPFYAPGYDLDTIEGRVKAILMSDKPNGLVLDFAGNTHRLGPINDPRIPRKKGEGNGEIPIKQCDHCGCLNHISAVVCVNCGEEFPIAVKITEKASTMALIVRDEPQVENFKVQRVVYDAHVRPGRTPSLKVSYYCGVRRFVEWVCLEHHGNPILHKAHAWWHERSPYPPPPTISDTIAYLSTNKDALKLPSEIRVWLNRKAGPEIMGYLFK